LRIAIFNLLFIFLYALNLPEYFSADFTQKIYSENKVLTYKGEIYTNSKNVYWKYTYPDTKQIWINQKVYIYEPDLLQVTISKKPKFNLFNAIKKAKKTKNNTYTALIDNKKIHFKFDKTLKKAWYVDDVGNKVEIVFTNQSKEKINPSLFKPNFPENIDIIYQN